MGKITVNVWRKSRGNRFFELSESTVYTSVGCSRSRNPVSDVEE